jgi:threonine aldolase
MMIDLRSDTVTKPTPAMRRAMAEAEVGDDVYGEDPTINRLEARAAEISGKEATMFVPSGIMGNTIGLKLHTEHGQEIICDSRAHILEWELAMIAWFAGCLARPIPTHDGVLSWAQIRREIRPLAAHWAPTGAIEIENTHNMGGGSVYPVDVIREICDGAHEHGIKVHMDGARVFNAAEAVGRPMSEVVAPVDTVMFCLSKGLGAPVGSMLAGTKADIVRARRLRTRLGGSMRQSGVLAAAGLVALEDEPKRLPQDHRNARYIAEAFARMPGIDLDLQRVRTNIIVADVSGTGLTGAEFTARLKEQGVIIGPIYGRFVRIVTHHDVTREDCEHAVKALEHVTAAQRVA